MKTKLVLWGTNTQEERVLIALELLPEDNKVKIYTFPEAIATEEFSQKMMDEWRNDQPFEFPEGFEVIERELTVTDSLLPDDLKVERGDVVQRAQTEWHFVVLSAKLNNAYQSELSELKEKVDKLTSFDDETWNSLKTFWNKVQTQVRERNLFKDHANSLRDNTNALFGSLKELRAKLDAEFQQKSRANMERFGEVLEDIENKIAEGLRLQPLFEELKDLQRKFRESDFTREHRSKVWERLDNAFKLVKEKRFGSSSSEDKSPMERLKRRYDGLLAAIEKMERSIRRDRDDLEFQNRKIASTDGQLEAQIRQAKIKMIEERIRSKEEKLGEMNQTKGELERRIESQKEKDAKRAERQKLEDAKRLAQEKIAQKIKQEAEARVDESEKLEKAAEAIAGDGEPEPEKKKEEAKGDHLLGAVGTTMGETLEDVVDTVRAVAEVVTGKIEDAMDDFTDKVKESTKDKKSIMDKVKAVAETVSDKIEDAVEDFSDKVKETADNSSVVQKVKAAAETVSDRIEDAVEDFTDKVKETADKSSVVQKAKAAAETVSDKIEDAVEDFTDKVKETADKSSVVEKVKATAETVSDKIEDAVEDLTDKVKETTEKSKVVEKVKAAAETVSDKIEDTVEELTEKISGEEEKSKKKPSATNEEEE
ncbi:MAG: hypothetical protein DHS20C18_45560 [Saprospiraceae bacterium]|nr:MAG: hypothetical protein DHS20C18_45560 [Saprospiraceae bacterium]